MPIANSNDILNIKTNTKIKYSILKILGVLSVFTIGLPIMAIFGIIVALYSPIRGFREFNNIKNDQNIKCSSLIKGLGIAMGVLIFVLFAVPIFTALMILVTPILSAKRIICMPFDEMAIMHEVEGAKSLIGNTLFLNIDYFNHIMDNVFQFSIYAGFEEVGITLILDHDHIINAFLYDQRPYIEEAAKRRNQSKSNLQNKSEEYCTLLPDSPSIFGDCDIATATSKGGKFVLPSTAGQYSRREDLSNHARSIN